MRKRPLATPLFSCVDLFSGCGGNSWGMLQEGERRRLTPLLALDNDPIALITYRWNMPQVKVLEADIRDVGSSRILSQIGLQAGELGCLIASPPCQTYSRNNRLPQNKNDYRNTLYTHTLRMVEGIRPWIIFMENVPEMETYQGGEHHKDFLTRLERLGYVSQHWIVNAADYRVPQHRYRLIYLAYREEMKKVPVLPSPNYGVKPGLKPWVTVEEAIADLPTRHTGQGPDLFKVEEQHVLTISLYAYALRPSRSPYVANHAARDLNDVQLRRLRALREGEAYDDLPQSLKPAKAYKNSYGRLWRDRPSPTLTTFLAYPSTGRFSHYDQDRVITIREALRLQSFNDDFRVFGSLIEQSAQVGNAVPPLLAAAFKDVIVADLEEVEYRKQGQKYRCQICRGESVRDVTEASIRIPSLAAIRRAAEINRGMSTANEKSGQ